MKSTHEQTSHFYELETSLHKRQVRNSPEAVAELLGDDFIEVGSSGKVWDKPAIIASLKEEVADLEVTVEEFNARELAPDVVLVTYTALRTGADRSLRASIWKRSGSRWRMVFHQGTRIPQS